MNHCDLKLLQRSLDEQLSEPQEEQLTAHLSNCGACRDRLEAIVGKKTWGKVAMALKVEASGEYLRSLSQLANDSSTPANFGNDHGGNDHSDDKQNNYQSDFKSDFEGETDWKESDFIVDYLRPSDSQDSIGRLGTIEIRQFIGQGAHGVVLKGFQEELQRLVAVKVMAPHLASVAAARKRFAREARATAAIVHPNVMPILHVDSSGPLPFLVMPYVDCESLQQRLDREGPLSPLIALRIGLQVAHALAAAHAQGLVHRDVKPANILLERSVERVMLTDFGLARAVDDATLTRSGLIAGTPHYMSPEQARGDAIDTRSDLFSMGSVMYAMLAGRPPFRAESAYGILRRVTDDTPRPLGELGLESNVPCWLEAIVFKLLHKSAEERFKSAEEVARLLGDCIAHWQQPSAIPLPERASVMAEELAKSRGIENPERKIWKRTLACSVFVGAFSLLASWFIVNHELRHGAESDRVRRLQLERSNLSNRDQQDRASKPIDSQASHQTTNPRIDQSTNPRVKMTTDSPLDQWHFDIESEIDAIDRETKALQEGIISDES